MSRNRDQVSTARSSGLIEQREVCAHHSTSHGRKGSSDASLALPFEIERIDADDILEALPIGAYITDTNRRIVSWNSAAEKITGWRREDVIGKYCQDNLLAHVDKDGHLLCGCEHCPLHRSMVTGEKSRDPSLIFARSKTGKQIPVECSVGPIRAQSGKVVGGIELFRDMTPMMDELNRARRIQKLLLVSALPKDDRMRFATRYTPHDMVGGDFFRIEQIDKDCYAVLVVDVMGHGVAAALYTMQIRSIWEDHRRQLGCAGEFMGALNKRLFSLTQGGDYFATGVYAVINASTGSVDYVRAGHEAPLIVRTTHEVVQLKKRDVGLGLFPGCIYQPGSAQLEPGDSLLIYTDGAVEVTNTRGVELGVEGLSEMLLKRPLSSTERALTQLEISLLKYSNSIRLPDDMTLVCVQRVERESSARDAAAHSPLSD